MIIDEKERDSQQEAVGGRLCLEFANTVDNYHAEEAGDVLTSYAELVRWASKAKILSEGEAERLIEQAAVYPEEADAALRTAKELRATIYRIFSAIAADRIPADTDVARLNQAVAKILPHMQLGEYSGGFGWKWQGAEGVLDALLWPVIRSATELLTTGEVQRTSECNGQNCTWLFIDESKNHSRKWCDMETCGNREKSRRHYARQCCS